ncbi:MAG: putative toxin-antitoxin system toxin component, PIN family [Acidobacteriota bacterium]
MSPPRIVLDTNVLASALRSSRGASFRLLSLVGQGQYELCLSVPLVLEYEDVLNRPNLGLELSREQVADIIDYLCSVGHLQEVFFLWRPTLSDPKDEMILELAVASGCSWIVTFNERDFASAARFGLGVCRPQDFLARLGASP